MYKFPKTYKSILPRKFFLFLQRSIGNPVYLVPHRSLRGRGKKVSGIIRQKFGRKFFSWLVVDDAMLNGCEIILWTWSAKTRHLTAIVLFCPCIFLLWRKVGIPNWFNFVSCAWRRSKLNRCKIRLVIAVKSTPRHRNGLVQSF